MRTSEIATTAVLLAVLASPIAAAAQTACGPRTAASCDAMAPCGTRVARGAQVRQSPLPAGGSVACVGAQATSDGLVPAACQATPPVPTVVAGKDANGVEGVVLTCWVKGDAQAVWSVLEHTPNIPQLFDNVKQVKLLEKVDTGAAPGGRETWEYQYELSSPIGVKVLNVEIQDDPATHVSTWKRTSGDLSAFEGKIAVSPAAQYPGYVQVVYESYIDGGFFAPQAITNRLNREDAEAMVPRLEKMLEQRQGGGGAA